MLVAARYFAVPILKDVFSIPNLTLPAIPEKGDIGPQNQHRIPVDQVSAAMKDAMLAAEDHRFYEHQGIDGLGIVRAMMDNIKAGHMIEGGSTIPQQLAKVMFLDGFERTPKRKLIQTVMVAELEDKYPKERILESYFNCVYFGRGSYSIEDAARNYFGTHAAKLDVAEAAYIAGAVRAPSILGAQKNFAAATVRQHQVIDNMTEYGYVTAQEAEDAKAERLIFKTKPGDKLAKKIDVAK
ncbi:MAG TPA: biosynthetic peptidoglycan transglycosylase [Planktothrix sp.]